MDIAALLIPADMGVPMELAGNSGDFTYRMPLYVARVDCQNPDDFDVAFYSNHYGKEIGTDELSDNHRASMTARALAPRPEDAPPLKGDIIMRCPEELARMLIDNDAEFQAESKVITAFRSWLENYATTNNVDKASAFLAVERYVDHVRESMTCNQVNRLAALLGVDPSQIGIVVL